MSTKISLVSLEEKPKLHIMFSQYLRELYENANIEEEEPFFEKYWIESDRWPYYIIKDGAIAGFTLINTWSPSGKGTDFSVAEFYILPEYRGGGIGKQALTEIIKLHPGYWEISALKENIAGIAFWNKVIHSSGMNSIEKIILDEEIVLRFSSNS